MMQHTLTDKEGLQNKSGLISPLRIRCYFFHQKMALNNLVTVGSLCLAIASLIFVTNQGQTRFYACFSCLPFLG